MNTIRCLLLGLPVFLASGCAGPEENVSKSVASRREQQPGSAANQKTSPDDQETSPLNYSLPDDVPRPIEARLRLELNYRMGQQLVWRSKASPQQAREQMAGGFQASGWKIVQTRKFATGEAFAVTKGARRCTVIVGWERPTTVILLLDLEHERGNKRPKTS